MTSPFKGVPKQQWPEIKAQMAKDRAARAAAVQALRDFSRNHPLSSQAEPGSVETAAGPAEARRAPAETKVAPAGARVMPTPTIAAADETMPPNLFSGQMRRMEVEIPPRLRELFRHRWFNDDGDNIPRARRSGWDFQSRDEVQLYDAVTPRNNDTGSNVRMYVGQAANGEPMYAYLLRKPVRIDDEHQFGAQSREVLIHQQIENQIRQGTLGEQPGDRRYNAMNPYPGSTSGLPPISISRNR